MFLRTFRVLWYSIMKGSVVCQPSYVWEETEKQTKILMKELILAETTI